MNNNSQIESVIVTYTNYRGETDNRLIKPIKIWFGNNEWHPDPQWLIDVIDIERNLERTFAMNSIHKWVNASESEFHKISLSKKAKN